MNIAILISTLCGGGAERVACDLSRMLSKKHNVHLIVMDDSDISYAYEGTLHCLKKQKSRIQLLRLYRRMENIKNIKRHEKIDVSISFMDFMNRNNCLSRVNDIVISTIHSNMTQCNILGNKRSRFMRLLDFKIAFPVSDAIVAVSKDVEDDLIKNFKAPKHKTRTIYNPCDIERLFEFANEHISEVARLSSKNIIITMGRCTPVKGQWHLIRAMKKVIEVIPGTKLYILGTGELRAKLEKLSDDLGLSESVVFMGFIKNPHAHLVNGDVFVLPSIHEGLPLVLLESIACGVPAISADFHSGAREILSPGTEIKEQLDEYELAPYGILTSVCGAGNFNATDPLTPQEKQLADAIIYLLQNDDVRNEYAQKGKERAKDFLPERITEEWEKLFEELTHG